MVGGENVPHRILKTHVAFSCFFVSVRRTVFVSVSAAKAVGFRRADPHGRCNSIKPLCGSASRKSRQRFAAFAAFVVTAKRPLSEAQNFNSPLYDYDSSLQLNLSVHSTTTTTPYNYQGLIDHEDHVETGSGVVEEQREVDSFWFLVPSQCQLTNSLTHPLPQ